MALKHRICVEVSFGSEIQRDVSLRVLREYLEAFKTSVESAHKRNEVIISERELSDAEKIWSGTDDSEA
jgi:hypothetical protein